jgi:hypothetical protein
MAPERRAPGEVVLELQTPQDSLGQRLKRLQARARAGAALAARNVAPVLNAMQHVLGDEPFDCARVSPRRTIVARRGESDDYLDAVVKETLRLCPAVPVVMRRLVEPTQLGGYTIPAGTIVAPCVFLMHRRADIYPQPRSFRPERFLEDPAGTYTWISFGGGVRRRAQLTLGRPSGATDEPLNCRHTGTTSSGLQSVRATHVALHCLVNPASACSCSGRASFSRIDASTWARGFKRSNRIFVTSNTRYPYHVPIGPVSTPGLAVKMASFKFGSP